MQVLAAENMEVQTAEGHCHRAEEPVRKTLTILADNKAGAWKGAKELGLKKNLYIYIITLEEALGE